jgi:hypothetical protein
MNSRRLRLLVKLFQDRFFENDTVAPGGGFQTNIYQVAGFLIAAGWFVSYFLMPPFLQLSLAKPAEQTDWAIRSLRLFFTSYSFAVVGFAAIFEWDMLFPDRRDFLVLGTFPISLRELLAAKIAALGSFLLLLVAAMNFFPILMMVLLSILVPSLHGTGLKLVAAQVAATGGASLFAFLAVACLQGILISSMTPRLFQRTSPWIQMFGMSIMVLSLLWYPIYSILLKPAADHHLIWPWLFPPVWFVGVYDLILPAQNAVFVRFGAHALTALAIAAAAASITWAFAYRRHYYRTLEAEDLALPASGWTSPVWLCRAPEERAIADFTRRTLARSRKHKLFLSTYISVGLSFAVLFAVAVRAGELTLSREGLRAFPFLIAFFVISGFRAVLQFPAELPANWIFQMAEAQWTETARRATRKRVVLGGLLPALLLVLPLELVIWDWPHVFLHGAFQLMAGALLVEILFWTFDKVPFTCSYFAGGTNLSLLAGLYLYGFTNYSFHLADLERAIESHWSYAALAFTASGVLLTLSWLRRTPPADVRFDAEEPVIRTLDLT